MTILQTEIVKPFRNTKDKGKRAESAIILELVKRGYTVLTPIGDNERYDFIIDDHPRYIRIQCKTGKYYDDKGYIVFKPANVVCTMSQVRQKSYVGQIDYFFVYCFELDKIYIVNIDEVKAYTGHNMFLRVKPLIWKNSDRINWAKDYELDVMLPKLLK